MFYHILQSNSSGYFELTMDVNQIYTLTTIATGKKGEYPDPPSALPFPLPYMDTFDGK